MRMTPLKQEHQNDSESADRNQRTYEEALRNPDALSIARICVPECLPSDSTPQDAVLRSLEMVFTVDTWLRDREAMEFLYSLACSATKRRGRTRSPDGPSHKSMWEDFITGRRPPEPATGEAQMPVKVRAARKILPTAAGTDTDAKFLTKKELAKRWKVSTVTLDRWRRSGVLRTVYVGRMPRFRLTEIETMERQGEV